ncbi:uncharacterized protein LOC135827718 isoform X2 [Sycon ciliatum]|uniref:uncharacterized protein LOC135827718 isoform X2 n=1 Tax=Sycon ciliatum TaxID=27933 RepID=UPI0031F67A02
MASTGRASANDVAGSSLLEAAEDGASTSGTAGNASTRPQETEDPSIAQARRHIKESLCVTSGPKLDRENEQDERLKEMSQTSMLLKSMRFVSAFLLFLAIMVCVLASKTAFFVVVFRFRNSLNATGVAKPLTDTLDLPREAGITFATLFILLVTPHVFILLWSFWSGCLGRKTDNYPWPRREARLWAVLVGILESLGMVLFVLGACVDLPTPLAIALSSGVLFFSLLCPFESFSLSYTGMPSRAPRTRGGESDAAPALKKSPVRRLIWLSSLLLQVGILVAVPIVLAGSLHEKILEGNKKWRLACIPLSVVCLSASWSGYLQHKVNDCDMKGAINPYRTARWKSALIASAVKLVTTIAFLFIFDQVFGYRSVEHVKQGFQLLHGDYDMTVAILVHVLCGLLSYVLICAACGMTLHRWSMVLPLLTTTPLCIILSVALCESSTFHLGQIGHGIWSGYSFCTDHQLIEDNAVAFSLLCILWLTQVAYAFIFVTPVKVIDLSKEEVMFHTPGYNPMFLDAFTFVNWRVDHIVPPPYRARKHGNATGAAANGTSSVNTTGYSTSMGAQQDPQEKPRKKRKVYICSTMYREADYEQENLLKSILHVHKAIQDGTAEQDHLEFESHVFFDGAVRGKTYNDFVLQLFSLVETTLGFDVKHVDMLETPYGMQANWNRRAPGSSSDGEDSNQDGIRFTVHLKDGHKFRNKKRWSQVMYMSYVLDYCCRNDKERRMDQSGAVDGSTEPSDSDGGGDRIEDTFILTTDADIVFSYSSVKALLDMMSRDDGVGAVCARTHPTGSGPLVWYQVFDYAIGHWFQKTAEHVIGSVMCCPGCFSVFRCRALQDVLHIYATKVEHATEFLTKDMGEDRWLCTLLVEKGWQLVYCAASENHTFCPDNFEEFYKQRRRWIPSTLANLGLCVEHSKKIVQNNDSVGWWFILYQALMIFSTIISPGTIVLLMSSGLVYAYGWNNIASLVFISLVTVAFGVICISFKQYEMAAAKLLTFIFAILMVAVFVGVLRQISLDAGTENCDKICEPLKNESYIPSPGDNCHTGYELVMYNCTHNSFFGAPVGITTIYLGSLTGMFVIAGLVHPTELFCLVHGVWYLLCLPSGYIFLFVYSLCNMDSQSWGTREAKTASGPSGSGTWQETIQSRLNWLRETFGGLHDNGGYRGIPATDTAAVEAAMPRPSHPPPANQPTLIPAATGQQQQQQVPSAVDAAVVTATTTGTTSLHVAPETAAEHVHEVQETAATVPEASHPSATAQGVREGRTRSLREATSSLPSTGHAGVQQASQTSRQSQQDRSREPEQAILPCLLVDRTHISTFLAKYKLENLAGRFEEEGYDDAMFLVGMSKDEMARLGVELSVHRAHLSRDIKALPPVPFEHGVPDSIESWLKAIGLPMYSQNFQSRSYITSTGDDNIEGIKELTKEKLIEEIGIRKRGHLKHIVKAIEFIRYPTERELRIKEVRKKIAGRSDPTLAREQENRAELLFWEALRDACMKPEMAALGINKEIGEKLVELRNYSIMTVAIANVLWMVIIQTLAMHPELNVADTNPIGLLFLLVYGLVYATQFISMLVHRLITIMHMLASAKEAGSIDPIVVVEIPAGGDGHLTTSEMSRNDSFSPPGYQLLNDSGDDPYQMQPLLSQPGGYQRSSAVAMVSNPRTQRAATNRNKRR